MSPTPSPAAPATPEPTLSAFAPIDVPEAPVTPAPTSSPVGGTITLGGSSLPKLALVDGAAATIPTEAAAPLDADAHAGAVPPSVPLVAATMPADAVDSAADPVTPTATGPLPTLAPVGDAPIAASPPASPVDALTPTADPIAPSPAPVASMAASTAPAIDPAAPATDPMAPAIDPMAPAVDPMAPAGAALPTAVAPQLPTIAPPQPAAAAPAAATSAIPGTEGLTIEQIQAIQSAQSGARPTAARRVGKRSTGQQIRRVVLAAILVGGLGAGARFGFDEYERRQAESDTAAAQEASTFLPAIGSGLPTAAAERPSGRYMHVVVDVENATDSITTTIRHDLSSGAITIDETGTDDGEPFAYMIDVRGDTIAARPDSSSPWVAVTDDPLFAESVAESRQIAAGAIVFGDIVPPEMVPYVRVLSETDEVLPVVPLDVVVDTALENDDDADDGGRISTSGNSDGMLDDVIDNVVPDEPASTSTRPGVVRPAGPTTVRHYEIQLDTDGFSEQFPFMYADAFFGVRFEETIGLWVDDLGIVRQIELGGDSDASIVFTYHDIAPALPGFQDVGIVPVPMAEQES
ncbi:hypothetical protein [Ilumatobacter coccineus]|uniref:hypothetical protein n=1 Tax=Ilumatobacter coccineus TaxID=467094 RepID=UPI00138B066B|nr:hypothetical protein [Ilumatobacter coccineus]